MLLRITKVCNVYCEHNKYRAAGPEETKIEPYDHFSQQIFEVPLNAITPDQARAIPKRQTVA